MIDIDIEILSPVITDVNRSAVLSFALFVHVFSLELAGGEILIEGIIPGNQTP